MNEKRTIKIEVTAYKDQHRNPTCAKDFRDGSVCEFYRTQSFGCHETCLFSPDSRRGRYVGMERRELADGGIGTLIPGDWCPVWKDEIQHSEENDMGEIKKLKKQIKDLQERLESVYDAGLWGICHVGSANYIEREREAKDKICKAMYDE